MQTIRVTEEFVSLQGSGHLIGTQQYFIRLAGCSVLECPIRSVCDEPEALSPTAGEDVDVIELANRVQHRIGQGGWVHVTGGEPIDHGEALTALGVELGRRGMRLHVQTSGTRFASMPWEWITVSPKCSAADLKVRIGQEMVVVHTPDLTLQRLRELHDSTRFWFYYIQPLAGESPEATAELVLHANKGTGMTWAMTDQRHKVWGMR